MYCKNCGKEIDDSAKFCQNCGTRISQFVSKFEDEKQEKKHYNFNWGEEENIDKAPKKIHFDWDSVLSTKDKKYNGFGIEETEVKKTMFKDEEEVERRTKELEQIENEATYSFNETEKELIPEEAKVEHRLTLAELEKEIFGDYLEENEEEEIPEIDHSEIEKEEIDLKLEDTLIYSRGTLFTEKVDKERDEDTLLEKKNAFDALLNKERERLEETDNASLSDITYEKISLNELEKVVSDVEEVNEELDKEEKPEKKEIFAFLKRNKKEERGDVALDDKESATEEAMEKIEEVKEKEGSREKKGVFSFLTEEDEDDLTSELTLTDFKEEIDDEPIKETNEEPIIEVHDELIEETHEEPIIEVHDEPIKETHEEPIIEVPSPKEEKEDTIEITVTNLTPAETKEEKIIPEFKFLGNDETTEITDFDLTSVEETTSMLEIRERLKEKRTEYTLDDIYSMEEDQPKKKYIFLKVIITILLIGVLFEAIVVISNYFWPTATFTVAVNSFTDKILLFIKRFI